MNPDFINPLVLAYLGDSVLELLVRDYLVKESELKSKMSCAKKQLILLVVCPMKNLFYIY